MSATDPKQTFPAAESHAYLEATTQGLPPCSAPVDPMWTLLCNADASPASKLSSARLPEHLNGKVAQIVPRSEGIPRRSQCGQRSGQDRLARLSLASHLCGGDARIRQPQGLASQQSGQVAHHQCGHSS